MTPSCPPLRQQHAVATCRSNAQSLFGVLRRNEAFDRRHSPRRGARCADPNQLLRKIVTWPKDAGSTETGAAAAKFPLKENKRGVLKRNGGRHCCQPPLRRAKDMPVFVTW